MICDEIKELLKTELKKMAAFEVKMQNKAGKLDEVSQLYIRDNMTILKAEGTNTVEGRVALAKVNVLLSELQDVTTLDKIKTLIHISTLGNVSTMIRNPVGNLGAAGLSGVEETTISPIVDALTSIITKQSRNYIFSPIGKSSAYIKGFQAGIKTWTRGIKEGVNLSLTTAGQLETKGTGRVFRGQNIVSKTLNQFDQIIRHGLALGDIPFFEAAMEARAFELSKITGGKLNTEAQTEVMRYSLEKVFMDKNLISETGISVKRAFRDIPLLNVVVESFFPFTQTPGSLMNKVMDHTPVVLGKMVAQLGESYKTGKFDQRLFVDRTSRFLSGSGILALGVALAKKGIITPQPQRVGSKEQKTQEASGQRKYQLKIGDNFFTIDWAEPLGTLFAMCADSVDGLKTEKDSTMLDKIETVVKTSGQTFLQQSLFRTLISSLSGYDQADGISDKLLMSTLIFEPAMLKKLAASINPEFVETYDASVFKKWYNSATQYIPPLKADMPNRYDILGYKVTSDQNAVETLISPTVRTTEKHNKYIKEIKSLYSKTGDLQVLPFAPSKKVSYAGSSFKIENNKDFSDWQKALGDSQRAAYERAMSIEGYAKMDDVDKAYLVKTCLTWYKKQASAKYLENHK